MSVRNNRRSRIDSMVSILLGIGTLSLYVRTLARGLLNGDSAEFQTITYTLGMGHPTGYPVYVLLGKIFTFLPVGEIAYRVNLFSAVSASSAVAITYLIIRQFKINRASAIFGTLLFAFVSLFWKFASVAEVYALSSIFFALIMFCILKWGKSNHPSWILAAGILGGVSLGVHLSIALIAPVIVLYLILSLKFQHQSWRQGLTVAKYATLGALIGVGLFLLSFLYIDYRNSPVSYYNSVIMPSLSVWKITPADFDSPFERLAYLFFPPQFKGKLFAAPAHVVMSRMQDFYTNFPLLSIFGLSGIILYLWANWKSFFATSKALLLLFVFMVSAAFSLTYDVYDYYSYYYQAFLVLGVFSALGFYTISEFIMTRIKKTHLTAQFSAALGGIILLAAYSASISSAWKNQTPPFLSEDDRHGFQSSGFYKFKSEKIVAALEDNSIVFTNWSKLYDLYYVAIVIHHRNDLSFHQLYPQEDKYQIADSLIEYIDANIQTHPIYFTMYPAPLADRYIIEPAGADMFRIKTNQ